jgi:hypothetical protein
MSVPPFLRRKANDAIGAAGRASEKRLNRQLGGKARPASGAMEGAKGDIDLESILLEAKSTVKDGMRVQLDWLAKISREARSEGKKPAVTLSFSHPNGQPRVDGQWVLVPLHYWNEKLR